MGILRWYAMIMKPPQSRFNPLLPYEERRLPCGAKVLYHHSDRLPIVAVDVWFRTGACNDPEPWQGISHFYEHMFFKGSEQHGTGELDRLVKSLGGDCNAATSCDYTHYDATVPSVGWREVLDVLIDSVRRPLFDATELDRERQVVIEEIARAGSIPWSMLHQRFNEKIFAACPYRRDVLGTEACLRNIDAAALHTYRSKRYVPELATICIVGDVELDPLLEELARLTEGWEGRSEDTYPAEWGIIEEPADLTLKKDVQQAYYACGYPTGAIVGTPEEYALEAASAVLCEGRSSRFVKRLKLELGIVSGIWAGYWPFKQAGCFVITGTTVPQFLPDVENEIRNEFDRFLNEGMSEAELDKVKTLHRATYFLDHEKNAAIAGAYGYADILTCVEEAARYQEELERLTIEDVIGAARRLSQPNRLVSARLLPENGEQVCLEDFSEIP